MNSSSSPAPASELSVIAENGNGNGHAKNGAKTNGSTITLSLGTTNVAFKIQEDAPSCAECGSIMVRNGSLLQVPQLRLHERLQLTVRASPVTKLHLLRFFPSHAGARLAPLDDGRSSQRGTVHLSTNDKRDSGRAGVLVGIS